MKVVVPAFVSELLFCGPSPLGINALGFGGLIPTARSRIGGTAATWTGGRTVRSTSAFGHAYTTTTAAVASMTEENNTRASWERLGSLGALHGVGVGGGGGEGGDFGETLAGGTSFVRENDATMSTLTTTTAAMYESLRSRTDELQRGIGRRYRVRTHRGFLNVHDDPSNGPFCVDNIVGQLIEGQIVTSVDQPKDGGTWIRHDCGGWSVGMYGGFTWLEPLEQEWE